MLHVNTTKESNPSCRNLLSVGILSPKRLLVEVSLINSFEGPWCGKACGGWVPPTDVENLESLSSWITREGIFRVASEERQERMTGELSNIQWK
jgi:hypothetical protein